MFGKSIFFAFFAAAGLSAAELPRSAVEPEVDEVTPRCFRTEAEARKFYDGALKSNGKKWTGNVALHGRRVEWVSRRRTGAEYDDFEGRSYLTFSWTSYSRNSCGSLVAIPDPEFALRDLFICDNGSVVSTGIVVSVGVSLSNGGGEVSEIARQQAVKNLAMNGMAVRADSGNPGGRLLPLKQSSRQRFGAKSSEIYLGFESGQVYIVLFGCNPSKMDERITPLSMVGNKTNQHQGR